MGKLSEVTDTLELITQKEAELEASKSKLDKKDAASQVSSLQTMIIRYQRDSIEALMRILHERDTMGKQWETFVNSILECREALKDAEAAIGSAQKKQIKEYEDQIGRLKAINDQREEEISLLTRRVKSLLGEH